MKIRVFRDLTHQELLNYWRELDQQHRPTVLFMNNSLGNDNEANLQHYRWYDDDGSESGSTALENEDTSHDLTPVSIDDYMLLLRYTADKPGGYTVTFACQDSFRYYEANDLTSYMSWAPANPGHGYDDLGNLNYPIVVPYGWAIQPLVRWGHSDGHLVFTGVDSAMVDMDRLTGRPSFYNAEVGSVRKVLGAGTNDYQMYLNSTDGIAAGDTVYFSSDSTNYKIRYVTENLIWIEGESTWTDGIWVRIRPMKSKAPDGTVRW